ncbi:MAG: GldG family protein, partial [Saprospiraceae bacterium]
MKNTIKVLIAAGILLAVNALAQYFFFRADVTEDKTYTLSPATNDVLTNLDSTINITAYFTENLPTDVAKVKQDLEDLLVEYSSISKGKIDYTFINPQTDEEKQEAQQNGIQPVMINVREKDQIKNQQAFLGVLMESGEKKEVIPVIQPGTAMEYSLTTPIKRMSAVNKPSVGIVQGHGEPGLQEIMQVYQGLSVLYNVENLNLAAEPTIAQRFKTVAIVAPKDTIPNDQLAKLDAYLANGGNVFIAYNAVEGDLQQSVGLPINTQLETWLRAKGIEIENQFALDAQCGSVSVQRQQGFFTMNTPVQFPYLPIVQNFTEHPITKGIGQVVFQFASPVNYIGTDSTARWTTLATTSNRAATAPVPAYFDINKQWTNGDFPQANIPLGGVLESNFGGTTQGRLVVWGDGDFPISGQQGRGQSPANVGLMVNS